MVYFNRVSPILETLREGSAKLSGKYQVPKMDVGGGYIFLLGIAIVIGGQQFSWNAGLEAGFYTTLFTVLFIGSGVALSPFLGFMMGCCESLQTIMYVAAAVDAFGHVCCAMFGASHTLEPLWWTVFYISALPLFMHGGKLFWNFNAVIGFISLLVIVMYCLGSIPQLDFATFVTRLEEHHHQTYEHSTKAFLKYVHLGAWYFIGIEGLPLSCIDAQHPEVTVPRAIMWTISVLVVTAVGVVFCACAQSPGILELSREVLVLSPGFSNMFGVPKGPVAALSFPGVYATGFGFMFLYGKQMASMSRSRLYPRFLSLTVGKNEIPYASLITGSVIGYLTLFFFHFVILHEPEVMFDMCIMGSFVTYILGLTSFIIFRLHYPTIERKFVNPLGITGAVYAMLVFGVAFVGVAFFQKYYWHLVMFVVLLVVFATYYFMFVRKTQFFSDEEQKIMLKTYIVKANSKKKTKRRITARVDVSAPSSTTTYTRVL